MEPTSQTIYDARTASELASAIITPLEIVFAIVFIAVAFVAVKYWPLAISLIHKMIGEKSTGSVLLSAFARGQVIHPMAVDSIAGYPTYVFTTDYGIILNIEIPFQAEVQLVGFSADHEPHYDTIRAVVNEYGLEKVVLEGDFPSYFQLYTEPGGQSEVRVPMNPKTMAYLVDFCQTHTWEVRHNMVYFASSGKATEDVNDPTVMAADVKAFVEHIRTSRLRT